MVCHPTVSLPIIVALGFFLNTSTNSAADPVRIGEEIRVSDGVAAGETPRIAVDPAGNFVIAWFEPGPPFGDNTIQAHGFWSNGNSQGPIFRVSKPGFSVGSGVDSDEVLATVADRAGNVLVAYNAWGDGACAARSCILTKHRDGDGNLATASFIVGDPNLFPPYPGQGYTGQNRTVNPSLAVDAEGQFIVAWEGNETFEHEGELLDGSEAVWARRLVKSGQSNGSQFLVNELPDAYQGDGGELDVAADAAGNFVVVWDDENDYEPPYGGVVFRRFDKAKNPLGVQTQVDPVIGGDPHVARLPDGTFLVALVNGSGVQARTYSASGEPLGPLVEVSPSGSKPEVAASESGSFVVVFASGGGAAGRTFDSSGVATSAIFPISTLPSSDAPHVGADAQGNFVVTFLRDDEVWAQRFQATPPSPQETPLLGKVLVLKNRTPDDFEKSSGSWKASGNNLAVPLRGSASDPRCNGDPPGTVKARARFLSPTSGQEVSVDLPCQRWFATGSNNVSAVEKRGYKYSDGKRADGPCKSVKIKGTKSLSVSCKGKPGAAAFPYDLMSGESQGAVTAVLEMGVFGYCAHFEPFFDGSDGKTYKGKSLTAPTSCP